MRGIDLIYRAFSELLDQVKEELETAADLFIEHIARSHGPLLEGIREYYASFPVAKLEYKLTHIYVWLTVDVARDGFYKNVGVTLRGSTGLDSPRDRQYVLVTQHTGELLEDIKRLREITVDSALNGLLLSWQELRPGIEQQIDLFGQIREALRDQIRKLVAEKL